VLVSLTIMSGNARFWIEKLGLDKHPEGGFFRETYRSEGSIPECVLSRDREGARSFSTAIYFLLYELDFSAFHRIRSDELWHFYAGSRLHIHVIDPQGDYQMIRLGDNPENGETFQAVVRAGCWFGAELADTRSFALVGCTVAPGFDYRDFEMAGRTELLNRFPLHSAIINKLTRNTS
jgi:predicted cupin superfamily sugar epimerase